MMVDRFGDMLDDERGGLIALLPNGKQERFRAAYTKAHVNRSQLDRTLAKSQLLITHPGQSVCPVWLYALFFLYLVTQHLCVTESLVPNWKCFF